MTQQYDPSQSGGPFLQVACICETTVQRADGVLTLVNIIDRVNITAQGPSAPEQMPATNYQLTLALILKAGRARGRYELRITPERPDGSTAQPFVLSLNFEGEDDRGVQLVQRMGIRLSDEGLYWFNVYLADRLLTRLPLRVVYSRITVGIGPPQAPPTQG